MSLLPQGLVGFVGTSSVGVTLVGSSGIVVTALANGYDIAYNGSSPSGTVLQSYVFSLANSFLPSHAYSATYNASTQFAALSLTTYSSNSKIIVEPAIITTMSGSATGISAGFWLNGTGAPIGAGSNLQGSPTTYMPIGGFFSKNIQQANTPVTVNACAFFTPGTTGGSLCKILGSNDGYSYNGSLVTQFTISEVEI